MANELVKASPVSVPTVGRQASLPVLVERAGGGARFAWDEFFYAEHHNPHTQKAAATSRPGEREASFVMSRVERLGQGCAGSRQRRRSTGLTSLEGGKSGQARQRGDLGDIEKPATTLPYTMNDQENQLYPV